VTLAPQGQQQGSQQGQQQGQPSGIGQRMSRLRLGPISALIDAWRSSIGLRVVATTLALSLAAVALLTSVLVRQINEGLLEVQVRAAVNDTAAGIASTRVALSSAGEIDPATVGQLLTQVVQDAAEVGASGRYEVVLLPTQVADDSPASLRATRATRGVVAASVPELLREEVQRDRGILWTYTTVSYADGTATPGIAAGGQLVVPSVGLFEMYYLFPLTQQQAALELVQRAVLLVGAGLVLLLGLVAWLVARQVARPLELAADTAEELARGDLSRRMVVPRRRPYDEVGRLAVSFNEMATSLQHQIRRLEELSQLQQRFVSDVSHELRTPLTTVRMAADVLHEHAAELEPLVHRSSELLQRELDRFEALLADLLEISRFDAGAASLDLDDTDLRDVVATVVHSLAGLAERTGCPVQTVLPAQPVRAQVDPRRVARVVRNLLANALEHGEGRPVVVRLAGEDDAVAISVRDHGIGLQPGESALVFNRFWRADPARARTSGGTGLGLAIALEDARLHGGWLQAWGQPGVGSVFRLTLPRHPGTTLMHSPLPLVPIDGVSTPAVSSELQRSEQNRPAADQPRSTVAADTPPASTQDAHA
jgi:two-component system sensor histidine kinase MtrB